jgi:RNA polymerase sigma-70 factor (ECF subfamily)
MSETAVVLSNPKWEEFTASLRKFIARRVSNQTDAEDLTQDVLLKIHSNAHQLNEAEKLHAWIYQIARRTIIDYYRSRKTEVEFSETLNDLAAEEVRNEKAEAEVLSWLEPMIADLPDKYREALQMTDVQGFTQNELAQKLDISVSGAKSRVQRGREKLKEIIVRCCYVEFNHAGQVSEWKPKTDKCNYCDTPK